MANTTHGMANTTDERTFEHIKVALEQLLQERTGSLPTIHLASCTERNSNLPSKVTNGDPVVMQTPHSGVSTGVIAGVTAGLVAVLCFILASLLITKRFGRRIGPMRRKQSDVAKTVITDSTTTGVGSDLQITDGAINSVQLPEVHACPAEADVLDMLSEHALNSTPPSDSTFSVEGPR